jgi:hypothetical protein
MSWIKRNLALVISGVIAIGLLGVGGWYLWSAVDNNNKVDNEIGQTKQEIERLLNMEPSPNKTNLDQAQRETARLHEFIGQAKRLFPPTPAPAGPLNNESFKSLLETTVNDLHKQAVSVSIALPESAGGSYYFTFENQRLPVVFPPESLRPLSERLHEVQFMMSVLIKARINRLNYIKRAMVPGERPQQGAQGSMADYVNIPARTNAETGMVLWPYELEFDCFTSEIATVIEAFERAEYAFVVKAPQVTLADESRTGEWRPRMPGNPPGNPPGRPGVPRAVAPAPAELTTVINERLLHVLLRLDVIKPEPVAPSGGPNRPPRRPGGGPP